jgi:hypothetical protein
VFDTVATYDDSPSGDGALLVDIAGSRPIEAAETILVGATHHDDLAGGQGATFFSAATELRNRRAAFEQRFPDAFRRLVEWSERWPEIKGGDPLSAYRACAAGEAAPDESFILTPR